MNGLLLKEVKQHWQELRGRSYDLLDELSHEDLAKKLPFPEAQSLYYQFWCMLGAQESWPPLLTRGVFEEFACSLDSLDDQPPSIAIIKARMAAADQRLIEALETGDLLRRFDNGTTPLSHYLRLVEHEAHHHGQLINLIYAHRLPIPQSWADQWALTREEVQDGN
jgi:hypothetical protein